MPCWHAKAQPHGKLVTQLLSQPRPVPGPSPVEPSGKVCGARWPEIVSQCLKIHSEERSLRRGTLCSPFVLECVLRLPVTIAHYVGWHAWEWRYLRRLRPALTESITLGQLEANLLPWTCAMSSHEQAKFAGEHVDLGQL